MCSRPHRREGGGLLRLQLSPWHHMPSSDGANGGHWEPELAGADKPAGSPLQQPGLHSLTDTVLGQNTFLFPDPRVDHPGVACLSY